MLHLKPAEMIFPRCLQTISLWLWSYVTCEVRRMGTGKRSKEKKLYICVHIGRYAMVSGRKASRKSDSWLGYRVGSFLSFSQSEHKNRCYLEWLIHAKSCTSSFRPWLGKFSSCEPHFRQILPELLTLYHVIRDKQMFLLLKLHTWMRRVLWGSFPLVFCSVSTMRSCYFMHHKSCIPSVSDITNKNQRNSSAFYD